MTRQLDLRRTPHRLLPSPLVWYAQRVHLTLVLRKTFSGTSYVYVSRFYLYLASLDSVVRMMACSHTGRQLFARYCRYGDRMNMGSLAKLKSTQFAKFCKDAGVVRNATGTGHFKSVDSDIVFKCLVAQRVMNEQRGKEKHKEFEATRRVATNGLDERELAVPGQPEASQWKHYSFLLRHTSTSMLNKALPFPDFVQALLLVGVKKYGDLQSYAHVREAA